MKARVDTSIIIPAYNEETVIHRTLALLGAYVKKHSQILGTTEVIIVAAGTDATPTISEGERTSFEHLTVIRPDGRMGKGRDVRLGFSAARGDVQLFMDADLSTPLKHIVATIQSLRSGSDVVIGVRDQFKIHKNKLRALVSTGGNIVTRIMLLPNIKDTQCGYKGFTRDAAAQLYAKQKINGWGFDIEILQLAKEHRMKVTQQPIDDWHEARQEGLRGDSVFKASLKTLTDVFRLRLEAWNRSVAKWWKFWTVTAMITSFTLAMLIGLRQSVWFDEGYSILLAKASWGQLMHLTSVDAHPPLYYLLLKTWTELFGMSEFALRSLSAILGAATIGVIILIVKRVFSSHVAVMVLPFIVVAPFLVRYDYEIRMYALASLIGALGTLVLLYALEKRKVVWWVVYATLVALGMLTLYMMVVVWLAHVVWLLVVAYRRHESMFKQPWWLAYIGSVILFIPWVPTLIDQLTHSALPNITSPVTLTSLATMFGFTFSYQPSWWIGTWASAGIVIVVTLISSQLYWLQRRTAFSERMFMNLLLYLIIVPICFFVITSLPPLRPLFMERYMAHFVIYGYALIGIVTALSWKYGRQVRALLIGIISGALLVNGTMHQSDMGNYNYQRLQTAQAKAERIAVGNCADTTIISDDPYNYIDVDYYFDSCDLRFYTKRGVEDRGGYAPLYQSSLQVSDTTQLTAARLVHLHWENTPLYTVPSNYRLVESKQFDKSIVDIYTNVTAE